MGYYLGKGGDAPIPLPRMRHERDKRPGRGEDDGREPVRGDCKERCEATRRRLQSQGVDQATVEQRYQACITRCESFDDSGAGPPCPGGVLGKNVRGGRSGWALLTPCPSGTFQKQGSDGRWWCCPIGGGGDGGDGDGDGCAGGHIMAPGTSRCEEGLEIRKINGINWCCPIEGGGGDGCAGGYKLADNPIMPGQGIPWTRAPVTADMGWYRDSSTEGHWYWHRDWGFQRREDVFAFVRGEGTLTKNAEGACKKGFAIESINGESWCCPGAGGGDGDGDDGGFGGSWEWPPEMTDYYRKLLGKGSEYLDKDLGAFAFPSDTMDLRNKLMGRGSELLGKKLDPYEVSPELQSLYQNLINRGGEYIGRRPGFSDPMMSSMFGKDFDLLRRRGAGQAQELEDMIAGQGLLGTGTARDIYQKQGWETERGIGDMMRDLAIQNELQKKRDTLDYGTAAQSIFGQGADFESMIEQLNAGRRKEELGYTTAAQSILGQGAGLDALTEQLTSGRRGEERDYARIAQSMFGQGMNFNTIIEQLNAGRRGESRDATAMMLQYLMMLMNSWRA